MNYKNNKNNKKKIIEELLHESDMEMTDEELIGEILSTKVTENYEKPESPKKETLRKQTKPLIFKKFKISLL